MPKLPTSELAPHVVLLDRDGVVLVNRATNIKQPTELEFLPGVPHAIGRLTAAGVKVAICTNQPEVLRGVISRERLDRVHLALCQKLVAEGAEVDRILCCTTMRKNPCLKPGPGMILEALAYYGAVAALTPFIGDQLDDLQAAFHASCPRILVKTGLGRKTLERGLPDYVKPVTVVDDLSAAVDLILGAKR